MPLYFKHLHDPTIDEAKGFGLTGKQRAMNVLNKYEPDSLVLLAIVKNPPKKKDVPSTYHGNVYGCCKLSGEVAIASEYLSKSYKAAHPETASAWPQFIVISEFWEFNEKDFISYEKHGLTANVQRWRGKFMQLSEDIAENIDSELQNAITNARFYKF